MTLLTLIGLVIGMAALATTVFTTQALTDRVRIYDLVKYEDNQKYTRTAGTLKNTSPTTATPGIIQVGYPVKLVGAQWVTVLSGDEANTKGLWLGDPASQPFLESLAQNAISKLNGQILYGGPAIIDSSKIQALDVAGAALTNATIVTALAGLNPPIRVFTEPPTGAQQTN